MYGDTPTRCSLKLRHVSMSHLLCEYMRGSGHYLETKTFPVSLVPRPRPQERKFEKGLVTIERFLGSAESTNHMKVTCLVA